MQREGKLKSIKALKRDIITQNKIVHEKRKKPQTHKILTSFYLAAQGPKRNLCIQNERAHKEVYYVTKQREGELQPS